jgi:hypothetical protein
MTWEKIAGIARHLLTFGGGYIVSTGYIDAGQLEIAVGAVLALGGVIWSIAVKKPA